MYQRLSRQSDKVIHLAHDIARERGDEYVGTEHVLLAIRREGMGLGSRVLEDRGVSVQRIDEQIARLIKSRMEDTWVFGRLPGSPHFRNVVAKAIEEAGKMTAKEVGTEHLLLALLAETGSVAYNALIALGCRFDDVHKAVLEFRAGQGTEEAT
jgi:ATP-dependent Clp protease ATP-binding subunit ClpC